MVIIICFTKKYFTVICLSFRFNFKVKLAKGNNLVIVNNINIKMVMQDLLSIIVIIKIKNYNLIIKANRLIVIKATMVIYYYSFNNYIHFLNFTNLTFFIRLQSFLNYHHHLTLNNFITDFFL